MFKFIVGVLASACLCSVSLAETSENQYFKIDLTDEWTEQSMNSQPGADVALYVNTKDGSYVTIAVVENGMDAKTAGEQTMTNMKNKGFSVEEMQQKEGYYEAPFNNEQIKGVYYFCDNGKQFSAINVIGNDLESGKNFIKSIQPKDSKLFPKF